MDYPKYPKSTPLSGKQAERVKKAIRTGGSIENAASRRLFKKLLAEDRKLKEKADADAKAALHAD